MSKEQLLKQVQTHDFILYETALYLDTHKEDQNALAFYKKHKQYYQKYKDEYVDKYGPLELGDCTGEEKCWEWVDSPWPWERSL